MWRSFALLSALFAAFTAILAKVGVKGVDSDLAIAIRTTVVLLLAWSILFAKGIGISSVAALSKQNWLFLALSGIATGLSWIFYFKALQAGKVSQVAPLDKASLAITILLSALILHEPITWRTGLGAALIFAGTLTIIL